MRILFSILISVCTLSAAAQFGQVGTTWTYNDYVASTHQNFPRAIVAVADTVILGQVCHIVAGECACGSPYPNYVYESNHKVYWFNIALNAFTLLYDFNLDAGGEWTVIAKNTAADSLRLHVDSIGVDTINGMFCKVQYIHTVATYGNAYVFEGPVIEWIGSTFCLYPQSAACDPPSHGLRCYEDGFLGLFDTHFAPSCEEIYVDSGIGISEEESKIGISLGPNPFHDETTLQLNSLPSSKIFFEITDAEGRTLSIRSIDRRRTVISRGTLVRGIYFYKAIISGNFYTGRFIII